MRKSTTISVSPAELQRLVREEVARAVSRQPLPRNTTPEEMVDILRGNLRAKFAEVFANVDSNINADQLRAEITAQLIKERRQIIHKLLGLGEQFGQLTVANRSSLHIRMEEIVGQVLTEWVESEFANEVRSELKLLCGDPKIKKLILEKAKSSFQWRAERVADGLVEQKGERLAKQLIHEYSTKFSFSNPDEKD